MENTQVRFANISIKASDEFMLSVDEERKYSHYMEYLIYMHKNKDLLRQPQDDYDHFSVKMPSKKIDEYELLKVLKIFLT